MEVGIVGLGLIGGSIAKSIKANTDMNIFGWDKNSSILEKALDDGSIDYELKNNDIHNCQIIIVALYPQDTIDYIKSKKDLFGKESVVLDTCGVKEYVCGQIFPLAQKYGFTFVGAHPMAGIEFSGYDHSFENLFEGASLILVPSPDENKHIIEGTKDFFLRIGFDKIILSSPEEHDHIIAYTSQLAHVVSSAYVKSSAASNYSGFSAGSFQDMTRVAKLNEKMWTELFIDNKQYLADEIDRLIIDLEDYRDSIRNGDEKKLMSLLKDGRIIKERLTNA